MFRAMSTDGASSGRAPQQDEKFLSAYYKLARPRTTVGLLFGILLVALLAVGAPFAALWRAWGRLVEIQDVTTAFALVLLIPAALGVLAAVLDLLSHLFGGEWWLGLGARFVTFSAMGWSLACALVVVLA